MRENIYYCPICRHMESNAFICDCEKWIQKESIISNERAIAILYNKVNKILALLSKD